MRMIAWANILHESWHYSDHKCKWSLRTWFSYITATKSTIINTSYICEWTIEIVGPRVSFSLRSIDGSILGGWRRQRKRWAYVNDQVETQIALNPPETKSMRPASWMMKWSLDRVYMDTRMVQCWSCSRAVFLRWRWLFSWPPVGSHSVAQYGQNTCVCPRTSGGPLTRYVWSATRRWLTDTDIVFVFPPRRECATTKYLILVFDPRERVSICVCVCVVVCLHMVTRLRWEDCLDARERWYRLDRSLSVRGWYIAWSRWQVVCLWPNMLMEWNVRMLEQCVSRTMRDEAKIVSLCPIDGHLSDTCVLDRHIHTTHA